MQNDIKSVAGKRKIIVFESVSLDNFIADSEGAIDWAMRDQEISDFTTNGDSVIDTFLFGRKTYDMMASYWPTSQAKAAQPKYAKVLNSAPKIVFSKTLDKADWANTKVMKDIKKEDIEKMKQQEGQDMMIFGSGSIVNQLAALGLIDEYQLLVNPVILGKGKPLFADLKNRINLKLVKTKQFSNGVTFLQYNIL